MADSTCVAEGCANPVHIKKWRLCRRHYQRFATAVRTARYPRRARPKPTPKLCVVLGCTGRRVARGWCQAHWQRWHDTGDVRADVPVRRVLPLEPCWVPWCRRVLRGGGLCKAHIEAGTRAYPGEGADWVEWALTALPEDQCWLWPFAKNHDGYGNGPGGMRAHRYVLERVGRAVPEGLETLHSCDVRACVNPAHLRHGTHAENIQERWTRNRASFEPFLAASRPRA